MPFIFFGLTSAVIAITDGLGSRVLISTCNSISLFVRVSVFVYKTVSPSMVSLYNGTFIFLLFLLLAFSFFFSPLLFSFVLKLGCGFLFAFHSNYGSILHHLRDKVIYWFKILIFSYPLAFDAPVRGVPVGILQSCLVWKN